MLVLLDLGVGNVSSIEHSLNRLSTPYLTSHDPDVINYAKALIIPGVGSFDSAMLTLRSTFGLLQTLEKKVLVEQVPLLGICLGMQLLATRSEEGASEGLGWLDAEVVRMKVPNSLKVPHIGWNSVQVSCSNSLLPMRTDCDYSFYFAHSYVLSNVQSQHVIMRTKYGELYPSAIAKNNIFGVQFHPERSHLLGERLLRNFISLM